jgi:transcriptional regulator GlxA family with amidase domain
MVKIAIVTLEEFNELDSFIALALLNRVPDKNWQVQICCPNESVTSMNGVRVMAQQTLAYANSADVVLFGSGMKTLEYAETPEFISKFSLDPTRQLIGAQCSGSLILNKLGLLNGTVSTDTMTAPYLADQGLVLSDKPIQIDGNVMTAGGCLASQYLAAWVIAVKKDWSAAEKILHYVAPVGQKDDYVSRARATLLPSLSTELAGV